MQDGGCSQQSAYYACYARIGCARHIINYCQGRNYAAPCDLWIENSTCRSRSLMLLLAAKGERSAALTVALTTQGPRRVPLWAHKVTQLHCFFFPLYLVCVLAHMLLLFACLHRLVEASCLWQVGRRTTHQALAQNCLAADVNLIRAKQSKSKSIAVWHMKFMRSTDHWLSEITFTPKRVS